MTVSKLNESPDLNKENTKNILVIKEQKMVVASSYLLGVLTSTTKVGGLDQSTGAKGIENESSGAGKKSVPLKAKQRELKGQTRSATPSRSHSDANAINSGINKRLKNPRFSRKQENVRENSQSSEANMPWSSLPTNLAKPGKGILRRGILASLVAAEAQEEAKEAANLLHCLRMFSELCTSASPENPHISLSKIFTLNDLIEQHRAKTKELMPDSFETKLSLQEKVKEGKMTCFLSGSKSAIENFILSFAARLYACARKMVKLTFIARVTDGLPLAEGLHDGHDVPDADFYKQQIMTRNVQEVLGVGEKLDQVSQMSSRLTSESRIYADKAKDLNRQALIRKWAPVAIVLGVVILLFWVRTKIW
ncbi:hypothetical protein K7X08_023911 [Anisodus acutangulus]|uniref:V-SNARE coiled-coil homology domain-containing protein n=1 Tax=Anisodus acutangulus TaxID=402998 RepID=A0A9Q1M7W3_9SOLA|nr:hypothetical protein K7X08_023911 [Anisodus acutangulus]